MQVLSYLHVVRHFCFHLSAQTMFSPLNTALDVVSYLLDESVPSAGLTLCAFPMVNDPQALESCQSSLSSVVVAHWRHLIMPTLCTSRMRMSVQTASFFNFCRSSEMLLSSFGLFLSSSGLVIVTVSVSLNDNINVSVQISPFDWSVKK